MDADLSRTPEEISRANQHDVKIKWRDGHESVYPARSLRLACACAACVHEFTGHTLINPTSVPEGVRPLNILPVGRYAIQITWSDGHATGIYAFDRLRVMCQCPVCKYSPPQVLPH